MPPINTSNSRNTEYYVYIKYMLVADLQVDCVISPPLYEDWVQLCMFVGHPGLREREKDFIYGGMSSTKDGYIQDTTDYFNDLKERGIVESFLLEVEENDDYQLEDMEDHPVGTN